MSSVNDPLRINWEQVHSKVQKACQQSGIDENLEAYTAEQLANFVMRTWRRRRVISHPHERGNRGIAQWYMDVQNAIRRSHVEELQAMYEDEAGNSSNEDFESSDIEV